MFSVLLNRSSHDPTQVITHPLIVDPVMVATSGDALLEDDAVAAVRDDLLPLADLLTPNLPEAARLLGVQVAADKAEMAAQARALRR